MGEISVSCWFLPDNDGDVFKTGEPGVPDILPDRVHFPGDHPTDIQPLGMSDGSYRHSVWHSILLHRCALEEEARRIHGYAV